MKGSKGIMGTNRVYASLLAGGRMWDGKESMLSQWLNLTIQFHVEVLLSSCLTLQRAEFLLVHAFFLYIFVVDVEKAPITAKSFHPSHFHLHPSRVKLI